ncbi:isopenicillin N synthase family dioxygenase [Acuticoccus mangrovi]|uniref:2-oxoglutarate-dependent ethylene/succinate-forming enzyme n=1 Tax=Acuticoccus mangrovi TaxID=2796142 RepID=A0A934IKR6_9HYPH|nr:isopenicillin N synthase family oxygenase [Acuticoccus mangrovi]MBJ3776776.1 isopenicillin N synthase family oxygenase [Acuticoccus mangrovi]
MFEIKAVSFRDPDAPAAFARSLRETGFAVLADHPITPERIDAAYAEWGRFFASPDKESFKVRPPAPDGYYPFRSENAKGAPAKDLKEFFQVYPATHLPDSVEATTRGLYEDLVVLGITLLEWVEDNTPPEIRARFSEPLPAMLRGSAMSMLRILHYPPQTGAPPEPGATRAAAHEDINLITLLVAGSAPGLEAQDRDGNWHAVPCDRGMIAVNTGDMLELASGGYYPSTTHRVVNPEDGQGGARFSMPMFIHPRPEVRLSVEKTANEYLQERLREIGLAG